MKLYIDNATNTLVTSATLAATPTITLFKEDVIPSVEIRFVENGSVVDIGTPSIRLALGKDGGLIAFTDSWTKNGTGATAYWTGNFNLNTQQAEMVLAGLGSTETILEVEVRQGDSIATKAQISVTLKTDLINETDTATDIGNIVTIGASHIAGTTNVHGIANTANLVLTNDARLSDIRDPKTHSHGNLANDGKVIVPYGGIISATGVDAGSFSDGTFPMIQGAGVGGVISISSGVISVISAGSGYVDGLATKAGGSRYNLVTQATQNASTNLPLITTTGGAITAGAFGTTANTFCQGDDSRLSDPRTPTSHTHAILDVTGLQTAIDNSGIKAGVEWTANHTATNPYLVGSIVFYNHNESGVTISGLTGSQAEYNGHYLFISRISGLALYRTSTGQTITQTGIYNGAGYLAGQFIWRLDGLGFQKWGPTPWGQGWGSIPAQNAVETPSQGRVYKCIAQDSSRQPPAVGGNTFWQELGFGFLLPSENPKIVAGTINTQTVGNNVGGTIDTSNAGGSISTSGGGGSINTAGSGSIQFGVSGQRTTLVGSASVDNTPHNHTITLPNATGTLALISEVRGTHGLFDIYQDAVDIGRSTPWIQQITLPTNIATLTGGLPAIVAEISCVITNRQGTGTLWSTPPSFTLESLASGGVSYSSNLTIGARPLIGNYFRTANGVGNSNSSGKNTYNSGNMFIVSSVAGQYLSTILNANMTATQTTMTLVSAVFSGSDTYVKIDNEIVLITAGGGSLTPTITRGMLGTSPATHTTGVAVSANIGSAGGGVLAKIAFGFKRFGG